MTIWCSAEEAVLAVKSHDRVFVQGAMATPTFLIEALVQRSNDLECVEITHMHTYGPTPYTDPAMKGHFQLRSLFVSENVRDAVNEGRGSYTPIFLSDIPDMFQRKNGLPIDVAFVQVSPPDDHGFCSLGPSIDVTRSAVDHASTVIALVNSHVPRTHGETFVHLSDIDYAVKYAAPLYTIEPTIIDETRRHIGEHIANMIVDGATLQMGIGAIPDAVLQQLSSRRDLGIHTEMFSDGVIDLVEQGVITGARKNKNRGKIVASFVIGSKRILDFIDNNPMIEFRPSNYTNDTSRIRQFDNMVAINSAIQVDLTGQVCAESIGTYLYSGVGGQMDFLRGASLAPNGKAIIALPATASTRHMRTEDLAEMLIEPVNGQISRITPILTPGSTVTTSRAHAHYIVTEFGVASLHGRTIAERTRSLIGISAPQFREQLERAAHRLHLL